MSEIFEYSFRVCYADTDAGGVVYHGKYFDICERARSEFLRSKGIIQTKLIDDYGVAFVVKSAKIDYKRPAKLDDLLRIETKVVENTGVVLKINQKIFDENNEQKIELDIEVVCLNQSFHLTRIPKSINEILKN